MQDTTPTAPEKRQLSAMPYAVFVPVLVVMAHSAWMVHRGSRFRYTLLAGMLDEPIILFGMVVIGCISFFAIRPFVADVISRWIAFLLCIVGFTVVLRLLLPELAE